MHRERHSGYLAKGVGTRDGRSVSSGDPGSRLRLAAREPDRIGGCARVGQSRTISVADRRNLTSGVVELAGFVPAGATAITANVGVVDTVGSGFVAVNPGGTTTVSAASINWFAAGQILNNGQNLTLNATREVTLIAGGGGSTHVVIDVTGYYL